MWVKTKERLGGGGEAAGQQRSFQGSEGDMGSMERGGEGLGERRAKRKVEIEVDV